MKIKNKKIIGITSLFLLPTILASCGGNSSTNLNTSDIVIVYTNDVHCGYTVSETSAGIAGLMGFIYEMENTYENTTVVDVGDNIQGEAIGTISKGTYAVDVMNLVGYDYGTFGNHEFDYGMDALIGSKGLVDQNNMKYLSANFTDLTTNDLLYDAYDIVDYGNAKVAFIGISTPETLFKSTPTFFQDENGNYIYSFGQTNGESEFYSLIQTAIDAAKNEGADYIVGLSHLGVEEGSEPYKSTDLIANTSGFDVVLDGHSHTVMESNTVSDKDANDVILTQTGTKLANIGQLIIDTNNTATKSDDIVTTKLISATEATNYSDNYGYKNGAKKFAKIQNKYESTLQTEVATSEVELKITSDNGARLVRNSETAIGNLTADAFLNVFGADIAFVNGGGIRASINTGSITYEDIISIFPYNNASYFIETTGQAILDALEMGSTNIQVDYEQESDGVYNAVGEKGGFLNVAGISYTIDPSIESTVVTDENGLFVEVSGERRVSEVKFYNPDTNEYDKDLVAEDTYKLASTDYILKNQGDGYSMFNDATLISDGALLDNEVLIKYIQENLNGIITADSAKVEGRIIVTGRES